MLLYKGPLKYKWIYVLISEWIREHLYEYATNIETIIEVGLMFISCQKYCVKYEKCIRTWKWDEVVLEYDKKGVFGQ